MIYQSFEKFSDFDRLNAEEKATRRVSEECYRLYGADLDKCSTQSNEGCGRCILYREQKDGE